MCGISLQRRFQLTSAHGLIAVIVSLALPLVGECQGQDAANQRQNQHQRQHQQRQEQRKKAEEKPKGPPPVTPPVRDPEHTFQLRVRDWLELKRRNIVMQKTRLFVRSGRAGHGWQVLLGR